MKGRKPDPGAAKRGTAHEHKPTEIAPVEFSGAIAVGQVIEVPVPRALPKTKAVRQLWYTILGEVARHELRVGDLPLIEAMCVAKYRHGQAGLYVKKHGPIVETPFGPAKNPMLKEERDQAQLYDRLAQRLGLSPESRIRLDLMQIAGATMLGSLHKQVGELVENDLGPGEVIEGECVEVDD
jgi:P27 family predicted phage terminase small subunit